MPIPFWDLDKTEGKKRLAGSGGQIKPNGGKFKIDTFQAQVW